MNEYIQESDIIYHLAGSVGVGYIDKFPKESLRNNIELMNKLIPLFSKYQRKVIFASTSEVYGSKSEGTFSERDNASIGPSTQLRWGYATAKLTMEFMLAASHIPYSVIRFFNVVGPGQIGKYGMVLPRFVSQAKSDKPISVYGDGEQVRCFCHVKDAVDLVYQISMDKETNREIFNVGNSIPVTINELANKVIDISNSKSEIELIPYEKAFSKYHGDILRRIPDTTKVETWFGYKPEYTLDDIIEDML